MSTDHDGRELDAIGVPELTALGKRIELLRMERRMSKGVLAQRAGTSRQQLWRVMTGKSELTSSLCARLADVLEIDSRLLRDGGREPGASVLGVSPDGAAVLRVRDAVAAITARNGVDQPSQTLPEYVNDPAGLERTFDSLPATDDGRRLKRALLDAIEEIAVARSLKLPPAFFDLRRRVVNDEP